MEEPILQVTLPVELHLFVNALAAEEGYADAGAYVREMLASIQEHRDRERLEDLIEAGLDSGEGIPVNEEFWSRLDERLAQRRQARARP